MLRLYFVTFVFFVVGFLVEGIGMRTRLLLAFVLMGFTFSITQTLMVRELLVSFSGSEIVIGLVFGNWLLLEAIGSGRLGRLAERVPTVPATFAFLQLVLSACLPLSLYLASIVRQVLGALPGEALDLGAVFYGSSLVTLLLGLVDGTMFTFACAIYARLMPRRGVAPISRAYVAEAIGAILGGALLTYLLIPHLTSSSIILLLTALNGLSASSLLFPPQRNAAQISLLALALLCAGASVVVFLTPWAGRLSGWLAQQQWGDYRLLTSANSVYGNVAVIQREKQYTFFVDGLPIVTTPLPDVAGAEELVHLPILYRPAPRQALLVGGGVGGVLHELLKYDTLTQVDYAELDPLLIELVQRYPTPLTASELADPRLRIHYLDGRLAVRQLAERARKSIFAQPSYDLILLNLPYPSTLLLNRCYTREFFALVKEILAADGLLVVGAPGSLDYLGAELRDLNAILYRTLAVVFPHVHVIVGDHNLWLASVGVKLRDIPPAELLARWQRGGVATATLSAPYLAYRFDPQHLARLWGALGPQKFPFANINDDLHPRGLYYGLLYWNALLSPLWARFLRLVEGANVWNVGLPPLLLALLLAFWRWRKGVGTQHVVSLPVTWAIATTGFAGMTFDLVIILAWQSLHGYIYQQVGLLVGFFMAGLALGGTAMTAWLRRHESVETRYVAPLLVLEAAIVLYCTAFPLALRALFASQPAQLPTWATLLAMNGLAGVLVGLEFPLANEVLLRGGQAVGRIAGHLYAADLVGAFLAALIVPVLLIPVLGLASTCWVVAVFKLGSLALAAT